MMNCWSVLCFTCCLLATLCLWNCIHRQDGEKILDNWYGCVDQDGNPTDSYIIYKLPKLHNGSADFLDEGTAYMYLTPGSMRMSDGALSAEVGYNYIESDWTLSNVSINSPESMPGRTLKRIYHDSSLKSDAIVIMYNDEFPDGSKSVYHGHTKGVVVMSETGGFWLVHSAPMYPPALKDKKYSYPASAHTFGQSMLCISLGPSQASNLAWQLVENYPYIYESNIPATLAAKFPVFEKVVSGYKPQITPFYRVGHLNSVSGKAFTSFAKYRKYKKDLYDGLVAPSLQSNLMVETWRNGVGPLPSYCNKSYRVENIQSINVNIISLNFTTHHDHSKWAIGENPDKPYICIGDINRMKSQLHRAGGTVCVWSTSMWYRFQSLIMQVEDCPNYI